MLEAECGRNRDGSLKDGYTNSPTDAGGETKYGISKRAHPHEDIKNLTLERASELYFQEYWTPANCSQLDWPMNLCVFDTAVNMGLGGLSKVQKKMRGETWSEFLQCRIVRYKEIADRDPVRGKPNYNGWVNRVNNLKKFIAITEEELQSE